MRFDVRFSFLFLLRFGWMGLLAISCSKTSGDGEFVGPQNTATPSNFSVTGDTLRPSRDLISFRDRGQFFLAKFNTRVQWTLEITGLTSGASRTLAGESAGLDSLNSRFTGGSDGVYFFQKGETCRVRLSIAGWPRVYETRFQINALPVYNGTLVDDFENGSASGGVSELFQDSGDDQLVFERGTNADRVEGSQSLHMKGRDANGNYWTTVATAGFGQAQALSNRTAAQVYWNLFARSVSGTVLEIQIQEDENEDGSFSSPQDDLFRYKIKPGTTWAQHSVALSDFEKLSGGGNGTLVPDRILKVSLVLVGESANASLEAWVDYVAFTLDKPFAQP